MKATEALYDAVLLLDGGRIVERGSPDELLSLKTCIGISRGLHATQNALD
jgi:ABC-type multidrug transport system fused ATPase/permease subunit